MAPAVDGDEGTDTLASIEAIRFKNYTVYLDGRDNAVLAIDDTATAFEGSPQVISSAFLLSNDYDFDGDALSLIGVGNPINGTVALDAAGDVVFTPDAGFAGGASFTYTVSDGRGSIVNGTVAVTVLSDHPPSAQPDSASTDEKTILNAPSVLANDTDLDAGDVLAVTAVNGDAANVGHEIILPSGARLTINATSGTYSYDPNGQFVSLGVGATTTDGFSYTVSDGRGGTADAPVTITITGVNDPPVAQDHSASTDFNTVLNASTPAQLGPMCTIPITPSRRPEQIASPTRFPTATVAAQPLP
jgi:VCBS repeat-containing protein